MIELKKVNGTDINYIFGVPYGILYAQYIRGLGDKLSRCFAPLNTTVINANIVSWNVPDGLVGQFHCVQNDPNEGLFIMLWEQIAREVREKMTANGISDADIDKLLTFPNYSYLFYRINEDAPDDVPELKYTLVLCGWACRRGIISNNGADDAEQKKKEAQTMHQNVNVQFEDGLHRAIPNHNFSYTYEAKECRTIQSSSTGHHLLGICKIGSQLVYTDLETGVSQSFVVVGGQDTYILTFPFKVSVSISVINQKSEPQSNVNLFIKCGSIEQEVQTNSEGNVLLNDISYTEDAKIQISGDYHINKSVELLPEGNNITITIQTPEEVVDPPIVLEPEPEPEPESKPEPEPEKKLLPVTIYVQREDGITLPDYAIIVKYGDQIVHGITDSQGKFVVSELEEGTPFRVEDDKNPIIFQNYEVEEGVLEYIFIIPNPESELPDITVALEDKNHKIVPDATLMLTNSEGKQFHGVTDNEGQIVVPRSFFTDKEKIKVHIIIPNMTIQDCSFKYALDYNYYLIRLKDPFPWGCLWRLLLALLLLGLLFIRLDKDVTIKAVNRADQPLPSTTINLNYTEHQLFKNGTFFYTEQHQLSNITDSTGCATFTNLPYSVFSWVIYSFSRADVVGNYKGMMAHGSFLFHWLKRKYILVFDCKLSIKVVDAITNDPIMGASVKASGAALANNQCVATTDKNGMCAILLQNGDKVDELLTTAVGYSGNLMYNVVFRPQGLVIPLYRPSSCNRGVDNNDRDQGNHAICDYNMGQNGGIFILDFYTDSAADHIMVYDGTSAEYSKGEASLIYEYDGPTNTTYYSEHVSITFTSQYICVVVDNGTNWGYFVNCPN